jgi:hypothetical protein
MALETPLALLKQMKSLVGGVSRWAAGASRQADLLQLSAQATVRQALGLTLMKTSEDVPLVVCLVLIAGMPSSWLAYLMADLPLPLYLTETLQLLVSAHC